jgi:hypothetical protein
MGGRQVRQRGYRSTRITTATTTAVKAGTGVLAKVFVEVATTGITTFNDGVGTKMIWPAAIPVGLYNLDVEFAGKIEIVTAAADRIVAIFD